MDETHLLDPTSLGIELAIRYSLLISKRAVAVRITTESISSLLQLLIGIMLQCKIVGQHLFHNFFLFCSIHNGNSWWICVRPKTILTFNLYIDVFQKNLKALLIFYSICSFSTTTSTVIFPIHMYFV